MIDLNSQTARSVATSDAINAAVDEAMRENGRRDRARTYLGASAIGDTCERRIQYDLVGAEAEPHGGKALRIFHRGHKAENWVAQWMRDAGFDLRTHGPDGEQFGFVDADGGYAGHADGRIEGAPAGVSLACPALWEHKCLGNKGWTKLKREGLVRAYPQYADQISQYQYYLGLTENPAVLTALNADTMELLHLLVPFDPARCQRVIDRAVKIIRATRAEELLPRVSNDASFWLCKACRHRRRCWETKSEGDITVS